MYAYIKGKLTFKSPTMVVIDTGGIGYELQISLHTWTAIEKKEEVLLWTELIVKEDSHTLFGFSQVDERQLFRLLISVSGIGPNTSRLILSAMEPDQARTAILTEDVAAFQSVKGVGPKTAKRVIIELKDKLEKTSDTAMHIPGSPGGGSGRVEALSALMALGFQKAQAEKALQKVSQRGKQPENTEEWLKEALKALS
jgi:Holliday junction DNA helicase RuvA